MFSPAAELVEQYRSTLDGLGVLIVDITALRSLGDAELLELSGLQASASRIIGAAGAAIAGELAFRSRPQLGGEGLARRTGHRTVENLLKLTTGATKEQVLTAVHAGTMIVEIAHDGAVDPATGEEQRPAQGWLRPVAEAVGSARITVSASQSIARGLGQPSSAITPEQLEVAASRLVAQALAGIDADALWRNARDLRNELDLAGVKLREEEQRALRGLTHHALPTGGGVATWRMDPETYATFIDFFDRTTSPKRGGVRFVKRAAVDKARRIEDDARDYKQLASDALIHFLVLGADADPSVMVGSGAPSVRITVAEPALRSGVGFGRIDGQSGVVSIDTVKRMLCDAKALRAGFDANGTYIEVFDDPLAENRLYNSRQREILAAKFGGCMDPNCDRPPSWCEAHHIQFIKRDGGKTTISNAILLCKHHHLLYHNRGYEIFQDDSGTYWKIPPTSVDPDQTPIVMPLKTRNLQDLRAASERAASERAAG